MENIDWKEVAGLIGVAVASAMTFIATRKGKKDSDGAPPADRPPSTNELRGKLEDIDKRFKTALDHVTDALTRLEHANHQTNENDRELRQNISELRRLVNDLHATIQRHYD